MRRLTCLYIIAAALVSTTVQARMDLVTVPAQDQTELTVYNAVDLTLVRETRQLSFREGTNSIQFSWSNTLIDPTSLALDLKNSTSLELLDGVYPSGSSDMIVWTVMADEETSAPVEITYFLSGISWNASYEVRTNQGETELEIQQYLRIQNNSGTDVENAKTRVVVGEPSLVESIQQLSDNWNLWLQQIYRGASVWGEQYFFGAASISADEDLSSPFGGVAGASRMSMGDFFVGIDAKKEIFKKAVSEYQLYQVEGEEDLPNGWSKRLPDFREATVPFDLSYEIDARKHGSNAPVLVYKLVNDEAHELGKNPLPDGEFYVHRDRMDGLDYIGKAMSDYVPVGEEIELFLGSDGMMIFEERILSRTRSNFRFDNHGDIVSYRESVTQELELRNARDHAVPMKLTYYPADKFELEESSIPAERVDSQTLRWEFDIDPRNPTTIQFVYTVEHRRQEEG